MTFEAKTFKDFFDKWIEDIDDGERRECTVERYRQVGKTILMPAFGKMALADITDTAITRLYKSMRTRKPPYSQATVRMVHVVLSALLNAAEAEDLLLRNCRKNSCSKRRGIAAPLLLSMSRVSRSRQSPQGSDMRRSGLRPTYTAWRMMSESARFQSA
jgi:integrase-like protein